MTHCAKCNKANRGCYDADTLRYVKDAGCDLAQGYFIGRPMTGDAVLGWTEREAWRLRPSATHRSFLQSTTAAGESSDMARIEVRRERPANMDIKAITARVSGITGLLSALPRLINTAFGILDKTVSAIGRLYRKCTGNRQATIRAHDHL
jgi:hypothetical protein